ncbi:MAG TPA: nucleotidyltransferase domain-containing protein, partial [Kouleothrix sp.]|nr:nucleotidyltransferase domain-containing protein [Kouleothrix sp.]
MHPDPLLDQIVDELRASYGCHTVILYGSRARGEQRPGSDYDILGVRPAGETLRDARLWNGVYLDLFVYPEAAIARPDASMLQCLGGVVLCQQGALGDEFLAALDALFRAGPRPLPPDEIAARRV